MHWKEIQNKEAKHILFFSQQHTSSAMSMAGMFFYKQEWRQFTFFQGAMIRIVAAGSGKCP